MAMHTSDIQALLSPIFADYGITKAVLFGSFAKGTATDKSDIDLLVESGLHGLRFVGFMETIRQLTDGAPREVSRKVLRLKMAIQKENYEKTAAEFKELEALPGEQIKGA